MGTLKERPLTFPENENQKINHGTILELRLGLVKEPKELFETIFIKDKYCNPEKNKTRWGLSRRVR